MADTDRERIFEPFYRGRTAGATLGSAYASPLGPCPGVPSEKVVNLVDEFVWTTARPYAPGAILQAPSRCLQFSTNSGVPRLGQAWPRPNTPSAHERRRTAKGVA
ncbi:MAG TPA: hypothetical protein VFP27_01685, partial [Mycobacterium sp.]|nr:hypothetical protein [Mycobacterium sp.]